MSSAAFVPRIRPAAAVLLAGLSVAATPATADVVVGVAGPMSGVFAPIGAEILAGVERAVEDINALGGLDGEALRVEVVDDKCDPKTGEAVANQLVGMGARLVVGHACASAALPAARVYDGAGIILISPATTNPRFTDERVGPGVFRLAPRSDDQPKAIAAHLAEAFPDARVGFASDGSVYGRQITDGARAAHEAAGGETILNETFTPGEKSQINLAGKVQDAALDVLVVGSGPADGAVIATELANRGLSTRLIGGDTFGLEEYQDIAGGAADGTRFTLPTDPRAAAEAADVVAGIRQSGSDASGYVLPSYAAVQIWAQAASEGGDAAATAAAIADGSSRTVIGPVSFDEKGDREGLGYSVFVWRNGVIEPLP